MKLTLFCHRSIDLRGVLLASLAALTPVGESVAVTLNQVDAFTANVANWAQGQPNAGGAGVFHSHGGGPAGGSDGFMQIVADGTTSHGKLVVFNRNQWAGDYLAAGVARITADVKNFSATNLSLRVALGTNNNASLGTWFVLSTPITLPASSNWTTVEFSLAESALQRIVGTGTYASVLSGVTNLRLLHATTVDANGTPLSATLGVDNIAALAAASTPTPGDFNGNGIVDGEDLAQWVGDFGVDAGSDANGDLATDGADVLIWQQSLGQGGAAPAISAVPEPRAAILAAGAGAAALPRLRVRRRARPGYDGSRPL